MLSRRGAGGRHDIVALSPTGTAAGGAGWPRVSPDGEPRPDMDDMDGRVVDVCLQRHAQWIARGTRLR